jgi:transcriptional regulator with XRE-family HTH domain
MDDNEDELRRTVGKRLRIARLTAERTQDDLATAAGVSRSMVSLIEHGTCGIDVYRLRRMAFAAGTSLTALLDDAGGRP